MTTAKLPAEIEDAFTTIDAAMRSEVGCGRSGLNFLDTIRNFALRDVGVTDAMVDAARDAYWRECECTTGKFGMRKALEAALSPKAAPSDQEKGK